MDEKELQLYQEENLQALKQLAGEVKELKKLFTEQVVIESKVIAPSDVTVKNPQTEVAVSNLDELKEAVTSLEKNLTEAIQANKPLKVDSVTVSNIKDAQNTSIKVTNLSELKSYLDDLAKAVQDNRPIVNVTKQEVVFPTTANKPIAVRLSDGKSFYKAIATAFAGGAISEELIDRSDPTNPKIKTTITATDLDIRNLVFATDKVDASGTTLGANSGVDIGDVTVNNGSGASAVNIQDGGNSITVDGVPQLTVSNAIDQTAYALGSLAFSATSNITNDYILDHIEFNFSTTESKTITITTFDGTKLWEDTNTSLSVVLEDIDKAFNANENFTIAVTQTAGACAMDVIAVVREGSSTLGGNPTVTVDGDVTTVNVVHKRIHEGVYYSGGYYNASVADNASIMILVQGSTPVTHIEWELSTSGDAIADFYEGTTFSAAGTAVTMSNHNRRSANTFSSTITHTPTVTADGTAVNGTNFIPGGTKSTGNGSSQIPFTGEFVLAASTNYLIRFTNKSGGAQKMNIELRAYEHAI